MEGSPLRHSHFMSVHDSPEFTRVCPACGRRVPHRVLVCRCGEKLTIDQVDEAAPSRTSSADFAAGFRSGLAVVVAAGLMAIAGVWWTRPASRPAAVQTLAAPA